MDAARIRILIEADASNVAAGLTGARAALNAFSTDATRATSRITSAFDRMSTAGKTVGGIAIAVAAISTAFAATIGPAIAFESAFAGVLKTVDGSDRQLATIRDGLLGLSNELPTTAIELSGIAEAAGQLGIAAPDILQFTETVAMLGETTDLSFDEAATSLARFLNVTNGSVSDVPRLADILVELGNNAAATESEILTLAQRMASAFTIAGEGQDEILGLAAGMASLGLPAEAGATAMIRLAKAIDDATVDGGAALARFSEVAGVTAAEFVRIEQASPVEAIVLFAEGLSRLQAAGVSTTPILEELGLNSVRIRLALDAVGQGSEVVREALVRVAEQAANGGALFDEFGNRLETTASRIDRLQNRLNTLAISIGTPALDTFAAGADLAGDAIIRLADALSPLGSAIGDVFGSAGQLAEGFFDTIGGPAVGVAVAGLEGLAIALGDVLSGFASLGPAGLIIAALVADIALVGPVSVAAASAIAAIGAAGGGATGALIATRAAIQGLLLSMNPLVAAAALLAAAFVSTRQEMAAIERAAKDAGNALSVDLAQALDAGDIDGFTRRAEEARDEIDRLNSSLEARGFEVFLSDISGGLNDFDGSIRQTQGSIDALQEALDASGVERYELALSRLSDRFGVSEGAIRAAVEATGQFANLTDGSVESVEKANEAVGDYLAQLDDIGPVTDEIAIAVLSGTASMEQYAAALGVTVDELRLLASISDEFSLEDLFDPDVSLEALAAFESINGELDEMADQIGLTGEQFKASLGAVTDMAAAYDQLEAAVNQARDALAAIDAQQQRTAEAQEVFKEALSGVVDVETFEAAAAAMRELSLNIAASGISGEAAAAKQEQFANALVEVGRAAGVADSVILDVIRDTGLVPESVLVRIAAEAGLFYEEVGPVEDELDDLAKRIIEPEIGVESEGFRTEIGELNAELDGFELRDANAEAGINPESFDTDIGRLNAALDEWAARVEAATFEANTDQAEENIQALLLTGDVYNNTGFENEFVATTDGAFQDIEGLIAIGDTYSSNEYNAQMEATDVDATTTFASGKAVGDAYANGDYDAQMEATDNSSTVIQGLIGLVNNYDGTYTAALNAIDRASGVIRGAVAALSGFVSKTITLTTRTVTQSAVGSVRSAARSAVASRGLGSSGGAGFGFTVLADGGFAGGNYFDPVPEVDDRGVPRNAVLERPGNAKIYSAVAPGRFFAEPSTGGEAFIPLGASKREAALPVLMTVNRLFGLATVQTFAEGGFSGVGRSTQTIQSGAIAPQINVSVQAAAGMDERDLASSIAVEVERSVVRVSRQMANMR